jgi:hypothetical protein
MEACHNVNEAKKIKILKEYSVWALRRFMTPANYGVEQL